jgi:hypothetical protein
MTDYKTNINIILGGSPAGKLKEVYKPVLTDTASYVVSFHKCCAVKNISCLHSDNQMARILMTVNNSRLIESIDLKVYGRHHDLVDRYVISMSQMTTDMTQGS